MHTDEHYIAPHQWAQEAWRDSRLDILMPITAGLAGGQFLMALFGMRSYHSFFLLICLGAAGYATFRTFAFLSQLSRDQRAGIRTTLTSRDAHELFLPLLMSVVIYGIIAPNAIVSSIFACVALPHALVLLYLTRRYAEVLPQEVPTAVMLRAQLARWKLLAIRAYFFTLRTFRKTPDFRRP